MLYKRYRFPSEIIQYAVWLYYRFNLSSSSPSASLDKVNIMPWGLIEPNY